MSKIISSRLQKLVITSNVHNFKTIYPLLCFGLNQQVLPLLRNKETTYFLQKRYCSAKKDISIQKGKPDSNVSLDVKTTIKETTKTVSYTGVILIGAGVTVALLYAVFKELLSNKSPSGVYSQAFKKCCDDPRVQDALGAPIKGHGEENSRGRRRHVSHINYVKDGVPHLRMVFYLKGSRKNATVHLDMEEKATGDLAYRYLFVELDDYNRRVIVLEDNRNQGDASRSFETPLDF